MAKVKFDAAAAANRLKKDIGKALDDGKLQTEMGIFLTERVRFEARKGKPLNNNRKFPNLKPSTVASRRANKEKKHPAFSPGKSNVTITGQLLDAVSFKRVKSRIFELFVKDSKRNKRGDPNNEQVSDFLKDKGFVIFTGKGMKSDKKIPRRLKQILLRFLRKRLRS